MDYLATYSGHEHLISYVARPKCCTTPLRFVEFTTCYLIDMPSLSTVNAADGACTPVCTLANCVNCYYD